MLFVAPAFAQVEPLPPPASEGNGAVTEPETTAASEEAPAAAATETPAATEAEPELICRSVTARTESRLRSSRQRVCKTQAEWDAQNAAGRRSN
jgi:hypothetical protein